MKRERANYQINSLHGLKFTTEWNFQTLCSEVSFEVLTKGLFVAGHGWMMYWLPRPPFPIVLPSCSLSC